jgi:hypothetical protein
MASNLNLALYDLAAGEKCYTVPLQKLSRPDVRSGSWLCKNAVLREVGEKLGLVRSQATITAINGLIPTMFMTRVRL